MVPGYYCKLHYFNEAHFLQYWIHSAHSTVQCVVGMPIVSCAGVIFSRNGHPTRGPRLSKKATQTCMDPYRNWIQVDPKVSVVVTPFSL